MGVLSLRPQSVEQQIERRTTQKAVQNMIGIVENLFPFDLANERTATNSSTAANSQTAAKLERLANQNQVLNPLEQGKVLMASGF